MSISKRRIISTCLFLLLTGCATRQASVPDTAILTEIQDVLATAVLQREEPEQADILSEEDTDLLDELIPSLSLDENLLAPVEERYPVRTGEVPLPALVFFNSLLDRTDYGVVVTPDVNVSINLNIPPATIEEIMDTVAEMYNLDITRRGNTFLVRPGGLRTRRFTIDYLNVQRNGSSSTSVSAGNSQGGANGGAGGFNNTGGGFNNSGFNNNSGFTNDGQNFGGGIGGGGAGAGGTITTATSADFWADLETAITNLIGVQGGSAPAAPTTTPLGAIIASSGNQSVLTDEGKKVLVTPMTGMVIVTAFPHELDLVEQFINDTQEILRREVIIQIQFLEVVLDKGFQYAIDFNTFGQQANNILTGSGAFDGTAGGLLGSDNRQAAEYLAGDFSIEGISNPVELSTNLTDFDAVFRILQTRGTTQVISSPQLAVLNNHKALFQDGGQEFFATQAGSTTVASSANTTTSENSALQPFFSGISMDITPQISANGEITLHVHPIISAVDSQSKSVGGRTVPLALTTTREMDSVIKAQNGKISVLGGMAFERNINDTAGIPGISQVPILGDALEQKQTQSVKSEFIILLKPIMVNDNSSSDILTETNERFRDLNRAIDPFLNN